MNKAWVFVFLALTGPNGNIWVNSKNITAVLQAPPFGVAKTLVIVGNKEFYVHESPEMIIRMIGLKCEDNL